jgi:uncharacterized protein YjiS (DUF1127 family)
MSAIARTGVSTGRSRGLRILETVELWFERARQRRCLAALPEHLLKDAGLSMADVEREVGKPVWRA